MGAGRWAQGMILRNPLGAAMPNNAVISPRSSLARKGGVVCSWPVASAYSSRKVGTVAVAGATAQPR